MTNNAQLIENFYNAFTAGDAGGMAQCYAKDIEFTDPAFGLLKGDDARLMWRILLRNPDIKITVKNIKADETTGSAEWTAKYIFSRTGRLVTNAVNANFEFKDGKIAKHTDHFNLWLWAGRAFGLKGYLLGWTPLMRKKIRQQARSLMKRSKKQA